MAFKKMIVVLLVYLSQQAWCLVSETQVQARHFVFLVHGIGGNESTFHQLDKALQINLNQLDPKNLSQFQVHKLIYDTKNETKRINDFVLEIDQQMAGLIVASGGLKESDKISFITHSQGGLVVLAWLLAAQDAGSALHAQIQSSFYKNVKTLTTAGTPFWGSLFANTFFNIKLATNNKLSFDVGAQQLKDMSLENSMVEYVQLLARHLKATGALDRLLEQIKILNIAGNAIQHLGLVDGDTTVGVPSARLNYLYANSRADEAYEVPQYRWLIEEKNQARIKTVTVKAVHTLTPGNFDFYNFNNLFAESIHQAKKNCKDQVILNAAQQIAMNPESECQSPSYRFIVENILSSEVSESRFVSSDFKNKDKTRSFMVNFMVEAAGGTAATQLKDVSITVESIYDEASVVMPSTGTWLKNKFLDIYGNLIGLENLGPLNESETRYRRLFVGQINKDYERSSDDIVFRVSAPGFKTKSLPVRVVAGYTTFIKVDLFAE